MVKKAYQVNVDYPEGFMREIERQRTKTKISVIIGTVLGFSVAITLIAGLVYYIVSKNSKKEKERK